MSLPDATSILKRAREEEEDPPVTIDDVYRDVVSVISKEHPVDLCDGEGIYIGVSNVPRLKHITPFGRQYLFRKVAKQRGYVVIVEIKDNGNWVDVPSYVWDWDDFYQSTYDGLLSVWIRIDE